MIQWVDALVIRRPQLFLDARQPCGVCFISHAHSDHLAEHQRAICTPATARLARRRVALQEVLELPYHTDSRIDPQCRIRLLPAGHVLGSAMLHLTSPQGSLLYTGDFRLAPSRTVDPADVQRAEVLVMECTYGRPVFRFPPREQVVAQLLTLVNDAFRSGRQPIVLGYSLGKSQELARIFTDAGFNATLHGAGFAIAEVYEQLGVRLGRLRRYRREDFHGPAAIDLLERGVLIAPPQVARTSFVTGFDNPLRIVATGWGILNEAKYRYGVDHALPLSDHADFDELLELVERVSPREVYTHHGYVREFAETLRQRGYHAAPARPDPQLRLFE